MAEIVLERQTYILVADEDLLIYPSTDLYPSQNLFPAKMQKVDKIVQGTLKLDEILVEGSLQFGQLYSTKFEMQVYDTEDLSGKFIYVFQNDGYEDYRIFAGLVDSCKLDRIGTDRTIVAYDSAYSKGYINVAPWWRQFWEDNDTATLKEMRESLLDYVGISYEDVELPNDATILTKTCDINSIGFGAMLKMICELSCCFPHVNRAGMMEFIMLTQAEPKSIENYDGTKSTFEEYVTDPITGIQFYTTEGDLGLSVGTSDNPYSVQENILIYKKSEDELRQIGNVMMECVEEIRYTPTNLSMIISDFGLHLGDYITTDKAGFYVLKMTCNGRQLIEQELISPGSQSRDEVPKDIAFEAIIVQEQLGEVDDGFSDTADILEDIIDEQYDLEDDRDELEDELEESMKELSRVVASSSVEWNTNEYDIDEYGYGSPDVEYNITYIWDLTDYPDAVGVDKLPRSKDLPDSYFDDEHYYYIQSTGKLYLAHKTEFGINTKTPKKELKAWRAIGSLTKKGTIQNQDIEPSDVGKLYLDQNSGKLYELKSVNGVYKWVEKAQLEKVTVQLDTKIEQNSTELALEVNKRYTEDSYLSSRIFATSNSITQEVTRAKDAENSLSSRVTQTENSWAMQLTNNDSVVAAINASSEGITLTGNRLVVQSTNFQLDSNGNATFSGSLSGANGTFTGNLSSTGTKFYALESTDGVFTCAYGANGTLVRNGGYYKAQSSGGTQLEFSYEGITKSYNTYILKVDSSNQYLGNTSAQSGRTTYVRGNTVRLYAHNGSAVYLGVSGTTAITSDENMKNLFPITDNYECFFDNLEPKLYIYKDTEKTKFHRKHIGFGARAVEKALKDAGLTNTDFAGILIDKDVVITADEGGTANDKKYKELYSLRYEEFIALNTAMIQKLKKRVQALELRLKEVEKC